MCSIIPPQDCFKVSLSLDKNLMSFIQNDNSQLYIMNDMLSKCLGTLSFQLQSRNNNTEDSETESVTGMVSKQEPITSCEAFNGLNLSVNNSNASNTSTRKRSYKPEYLNRSVRKMNRSSALVQSTTTSTPIYNNNETHFLLDSLGSVGDSSNDTNNPNPLSLKLESSPSKLESHKSTTTTTTTTSSISDEDDDILCIKDELLDCTDALLNDASESCNPYESSEIIPGLFSKVPRIEPSPSKVPNYLSCPTVKPETRHLDLRPIGGFDSFPTQNSSTVALPSSSSSSLNISNIDDTSFTVQPSSVDQIFNLSTGTNCRVASSESVAVVIHGGGDGQTSSDMAPMVTELPMPGIVQHNDQFYSCPLCMQQFASKTSAQRHVRTVHSSIKFECQICQKTFNRKDILKQHLQAKHHLSSEVALAVIKCPSTKIS